MERGREGGRHATWGRAYEDDTEKLVLDVNVGMECQLLVHIIIIIIKLLNKTV